MGQIRLSIGEKKTGGGQSWRLRTCNCNRELVSSVNGYARRVERNRGGEVNCLVFGGIDLFVVIGSEAKHSSFLSNYKCMVCSTTYLYCISFNLFNSDRSSESILISMTQLSKLSISLQVLELATMYSTTKLHTQVYSPTVVIAAAWSWPAAA